MGAPLPAPPNRIRGDRKFGSKAESSWGFDEVKKARHQKPTAHARARYRCFLPDLAGLAGRRRAGPMPDSFDSSIGRPGKLEHPSAHASNRRPSNPRIAGLLLHQWLREVAAWAPPLPVPI